MLDFGIVVGVGFVVGVVVLIVAVGVFIGEATVAVVGRVEVGNGEVGGEISAKSFEWSCSRKNTPANIIMNIAPTPNITGSQIGRWGELGTGEVTGSTGSRLTDGMFSSIH